MAMHELAKPIPRRYPANKDAIGIDIIGGTTSVQKDDYLGYEAVTGPQNTSLRRLIEELRQAFKVPVSEVFRHPEVSRKDPHEAESAK
ncbi:N-acetyl-anhydromuramyl-L-alanine amidase AmpD [Sphingomonas sp. UYAg733]